MSPKLKGLLVLLAVFVLGAATGGAGVHAHARKRAAELFGSDVSFRERRHLGALEHELDLSSTQVEQVARIMRDHRDEREQLTSSMFEQCGEPLRAHRKRVETEIEALLDPEQKVRFKELSELFSKRFLHQKAKPPPSD